MPPAFSFDDLKKVLPRLLSAVPSEWRGTTFKNSKLLGREGFSKKIGELILNKANTGESVSETELIEVGNAEDYLRVSTNLSTLLELTLATEKNLDVSQVFTYTSNTMPVLSVLLVSTSPVRLYQGDAPFFSAEQEEVIALLGSKLVLHPNSPPSERNDDAVIVATDWNSCGSSNVDAVVQGNVLYILNPQKIKPADVLVIRKRTGTPVTTPCAEAKLRDVAELASSTKVMPPEEAEKQNFFAHLQTMSGTAVDESSSPIVFTAGLPTICSFWVALIASGGVDVLMCSTAYGGSSQLTDILVSRAPALFKKHTFHIQQDAILATSIQTGLAQLSKDVNRLMPTTCLFVEIPTNPDMKVFEVREMVGMVREYKKASGRRVLLLVDTTFAPASAILKKFRDEDPDLEVVVFISMSKSISRGGTTAGTLIANHTKGSKEFLEKVKSVANIFQTVATTDQMCILTENHTGVEERCQKAYANARHVGEKLVEAVSENADGYKMPLAFVSPEHAAQGFTTSTFSFNLPPPKNTSDAVRAALAQKFVDLLTEHEEHFKPCVSFGQDNGLVYATVPATSTQGAIKEEDKAKQAVGGVQLTRLSFPPTFNLEQVVDIVTRAVAALYN